MNTSKPIDPALRAAATNAAMTESSRPIRWLGRALPLAILLLVGILAAREVRGLDLHAIRSVLGALSLPQLLLIQGLALTGVLVMSL
ncbi:hypothetical protein, partial [Aquamicrobium sp.]|uniref:hypothetical protein n=1 Tax=Aquamicrobium sp. TaxID=1872579 RepID=UPI00258FBEEB